MVSIIYGGFYHPDVAYFPGKFGFNSVFLCFRIIKNLQDWLPQNLMEQHGMDQWWTWYILVQIQIYCFVIFTEKSLFGFGRCALLSDILVTYLML